MKMHGLGDSAYWIIQYTWFLFIYCCYIAILLLVGSAINLKFFRLTNYGLQIIFFFVWGNCLIAFAFLASVFFTSAKTANVVAFLWVFGTGLLNNLLMENYYKDHHSWVYIVELIPSFALYRALYEQVHLTAVCLACSVSTECFLLSSLALPKLIHAATCHLHGIGCGPDVCCRCHMSIAAWGLIFKRPSDRSRQHRVKPLYPCTVSAAIPTEKLLSVMPIRAYPYSLI